MAESIRDFDKWSNSLRNFEWLTDSLPGATDIDVFIERKGNFLILETKEWGKNYGIRIPFGQYLALMALTKIPQFTVILIGETKDPDEMYWLDLREHDGRKYRTGPVLYPHTLFESVNRERLQEMVEHWYSSATANPS